jgi:hypothetical protein
LYPSTNIVRVRFRLEGYVERTHARIHDYNRQPEGKRLLVKLMGIREDTIKMDLKDI